MNINSDERGRKALEKVGFGDLNPYPEIAIVAMIGWLAEKHIGIDVAYDERVHPVWAIRRTVGDEWVFDRAPTLAEALIAAVLATEGESDEE